MNLPSIAGIDLTDGIKILLGNDRLGVQVTPAWFKHADLESYLAGPPAHTIAQTEVQAGKFLANLLNGSDQVLVHIFNTTPLTYTCLITSPGAPIPPNWWGTP